MNENEIGKRIKELRIKEGLTQEELANRLYVSDKAVSKWERGLSLPDSSLLPKIAGLLDTDLGSLIPTANSNREWKGLIIHKNKDIRLDDAINGIPILHYFLSYFLLVNITDITIITDDVQTVEKMNLKKFNISISFTPFECDRTMVLFGETILMGAYFSQQMINIMKSEDNVKLTLNDEQVPIAFFHGKVYDIEKEIESLKTKSLYRGMLNIELKGKSDIEDAQTLIRIYEKHCHTKFCDLNEIIRNRQPADTGN